MFEPFEKVLIRNYDYQQWTASFFSHKVKEGYICIGGLWNQCIPYEGNEHLLSTTHSTENPQPECIFGEHVEVSNNRYDWFEAVYIGKPETDMKPQMQYRAVDTKGVIGLWEYCRKADW